jgi:hypothetical protein
LRSSGKQFLSTRESSYQPHSNEEERTGSEQDEADDG